MISKWKYNYSDEEKDMALTIQNLKQEIDKLVDTIEDVNREFSQYKYENKKEIERLKSIIKEVREYIEPIVELDNDILIKGKMLKPVLETLEKENNGE